MLSFNVRLKRTTDAFLGIFATSMLAVAVTAAGFLLVWIATLIT